MTTQDKVIADHVEIRELDRTTFKDFSLLFQYTTNTYYDVIRSSDSFFSIELVNKPFACTVAKEFEDHLYADHLENPTAFGLFIDDEILGYLEVDRETWHNRLRVTELLILPKHRHKGLGKLLMDKAKAIGRVEDFRELVLETQSCNTEAIIFYLSQGFFVNGIDLSSYTNHDVENREVRMELVFRDFQEGIHVKH
jgi:ribosomal protein S18 acetylase RimI-like enzyme